MDFKMNTMIQWKSGNIVRLGYSWVKNHKSDPIHTVKYLK